ncbi:MAG: hypothetical protein GF320_18375 [Armatimonadia bacterium]|nr:hypothetical protein [Armatimonadia bacterium]
MRAGMYLLMLLAATVTQAQDAPGPAGVTGSVSGPEGPVAGARILLCQPDAPDLEAISDDDGEFVLPGECPPHGVLFVHAEGYSTGWAACRPGEVVETVLEPAPIPGFGTPQPTTEGAGVSPSLLAEALEPLARELLDLMPDRTWRAPEGRTAWEAIAVLGAADPDLAEDLLSEAGMDVSDTVRGRIYGCWAARRLAPDTQVDVTPALLQGIEPAAMAPHDILRLGWDAYPDNPDLTQHCADEMVRRADAMSGVRATERRCQGTVLLALLGDDRAGQQFEKVQADLAALTPEQCSEALASSIGLIALLSADVAQELMDADPHKGDDCHWAEAMARSIATYDPDLAVSILEECTGGLTGQRAAGIVGLFPEEHRERAIEIARGIDEPTARALALARLSYAASGQVRRDLYREAVTQALAHRRSIYDARTLAGLAVLGRRIGYQDTSTLAIAAAQILCRDLSLVYGMPLTTLECLAMAEPDLAAAIVEMARDLAAEGEGRGARIMRYQTYRLLPVAAGVRPGWEGEILMEWQELYPANVQVPLRYAGNSLVDRYLLPAEEREDRAMEGKVAEGIVPVVITRQQR